MARKRIESEPVLTSWDDVNLHLKEIGEHEIAISDITNRMNVAIDEIKLEAEMSSKQHTDRISVLAREIKEFVEAHRDEIKGKTRKLTFGETGFRRSCKIVIRNAKSTIDALLAQGKDECIKITRKVLKNKVDELTDEELAKIGATRKTQDCFWYEVNHEQIQAE